MPEELYWDGKAIAEMNNPANYFRAESILSRLGKGIGSSALNHAILFFQAIVLVPFFLKAWGADGYGSWITLTAFISQMALLDLGGQTYIGNILAMSYAESNGEDFRRRLSEGVSLFLFIGLGSFIILVLSLIFFLNADIPGLGRPLTVYEALILGFLGTELFLLKIPGGIYVAAYRATGLFARGAMIGNLIRTFGMTAFLVLLLFKVSPLIYAGAMLTIGILLTIVIVLDSRKKIPECREISLGFKTAKDGLNHLSGAIYFWFMAIANTAKQHGIILILAYYTSPVVVALYSTHRALTNIPRYFNLMLQGPLWPELTFLWARKRYSELCRITFFNIKAVLILTAFVSMSLWLCAPLAYPVWTGKQLEIDKILLSLLLIHGIVFAGSATLTWSMLAANHHRAITIWSMVNAVASIFLSLWLVKSHEAAGVAFSILISDLLLFLFIFPVLISTFLKVSYRTVYAQLIQSALLITAMATVGLLMNSFLNGWWAVIAFLLSGAMLIIPTLKLIAGQEETQRGMQLLKSVLSFRVR